METGFLFRISAFAAESITFCITAAMCIITGYIDGSCGTFAVLIVGTVVCFAVNVNGFTSAAGYRYTCQVGGKICHLTYEENYKWFMERK